jgi:glycosyltransferase involved in cell wall biosynthesis
MALNVLQLLPAMNEGGVERGTIEICDALIRGGHSASVLSAGGRLVESLHTMDAKHISLPIGKKSPFSLRFVPQLRRLFAHGGFDIVHARSRAPAWIAYLAWRGLPQATRPRFVTTVHGLYSVNRYSEIMTRGERVIAVSETVREYLLRNYPKLDRGRIHVINRGVNSVDYPRGYEASAKWCEQWRAKQPALNDRFVVLLPGRLRRLKGHADLLSLVSALLAKGYPIHALIAGDDASGSTYIKQLKERVKREHLPVTFLGFRADLKELYSVVDLVLSLSTQPESFGRTVLEPLCLGTPVIGYEQGGVGEILQRMFAQGCVPAGDIRALIERVRDFITQPTCVTSNNVFPLATMQRCTIELYRQLASERSR